MTVLTQTRFVEFSFLARLDALRVQLAENAAKRKIYRTTLNELQTLSPRDLTDLGIAPTMIEEIAREAAYGK